MQTKRVSRFLTAIVHVAVWVSVIAWGQSQGGVQFLDGVGETSRVAGRAQAVAVNPPSDGRRELSGVTGSVTQPQASDLVGVPNTRTETIVGHLPRLPNRLSAHYRGDAQGPPVRVIWPAPTDNNDVLDIGAGPDGQQ